MRRPTARRGLTLVELLVTIALMLLIMSIIVAVFTAATEGMTIARTDQEMASVTRRLDTLIRQDLAGATARFTPPLDPNDGLGYFELSENSLADPQGEDSDDIIAFTAKAPPGQPFTGRIMLRRGVFPAGIPAAGLPRFAPVTITSEYAEIIYFLRNTNLYRRVLLIVPDRADSLANSADIDPTTGLYRYNVTPWFSDGFDTDGDAVPDVSWQGANDLSVRPSNSIATTAQQAPIPNTLGDLTNRHNRAFRPRFRDDFFDNSNIATIVPDGKFDDFNGDGIPDISPTLYPGAFAAGVVNDGYNRPASMRIYDVMPFPYVFPGAFTKPNPFTNPGLVHNGPFVLDDVTGLTVLNHSPLDLDDNLPVPDTAAERHTWWGLPTWAETRALGWTAANKRPNILEFNRANRLQAYGLSWQRGILGPAVKEWLPPQSHWYSDGAGNTTLTPTSLALQDDLIATNVRSFDVKALDPNGYYYGAAFSKTRYYDLGYKSSITGQDPAETAVDEVVTFGHEGRIPPLVNDFRFDHQGLEVFNQLYPIGDDSASVVRLTRTWDSWSTDYAFAPRRGIDLINFPGPPAQRPAHPSYPPPYPSPLFGIQIQIRLAAPDGSRPKVLTIRQDFTDKL